MGNIESITMTDEYIEMCDIEVDGVHCYYGDGIVVHNSAQELRIPANLSREPVWVNAFVSGGDVHKSTAISIWGEENYNKDYRKMAKGANFCESSNNHVLVLDKGYVRAKDVQVGDVLSGREGPSVVEGVEVLDKAPCLELKLNNGLTVSYHEMHKLLCWDNGSLKWVRVKDITDDIQIVGMLDRSNPVKYEASIFDAWIGTDSSRRRNKFIDRIDTNGYSLAYLMGLYVGDGNLDMRDGRPVKMRQCVSVSIVEKVAEIVKKSGVDEESINWGEISGHESVVDLQYGGVGFALWVYQNFGGPNNKKVPDWVYQKWDIKAMEHFIAGYLDADGSKRSEGVISLYSTNEGLIESVSLMCNYLGMRTYYTKSESAIYKDGERITEGVNGKFKDCHSINIYGSYDRLPLLHDYKRVTKESTVDNKCAWKMKRDFYKYVKKLRRVSKDLDVYLDNLRDSGTSMTVNRVREFEKYTKNFPIKSSWYPISVISKKPYTGTIVAIQTSTHEYTSFNLNSHNSILYGAAAQSFADNPMYHMNLTEAEEFYNKYKKALPALFQWEERLQRRGRREGYVSTYFGRPRRVKGYFDNRNFAFANRTIVNTTVQGTASDMLKIVLCKLWTALFNNPNYREDCKWMVTIHDEVGYSVRASRANEIIKIIEETQRVKLPEWPVLIDIEASCGWSMGSVFAVHMVKDDSSAGYHYEPKLDD